MQVYYVGTVHRQAHIIIILRCLNIIIPADFYLVVIAISWLFINKTVYVRAALTGRTLCLGCNVYNINPLSHPSVFFILRLCLFFRSFFLFRISQFLCHSRTSRIFYNCSICRTILWSTGFRCIAIWHYKL